MSSYAELYGFFHKLEGRRPQTPLSHLWERGRGRGLVVPAYATTEFRKPLSLTLSPQGERGWITPGLNA
jgi:hypothetical protein